MDSWRKTCLSTLFSGSSVPAGGGQGISFVIHKEEDIYVAECPEVGTASQGYTIEEALANLKEATELYLVDFPLAKR
jgi:hypothetical protein